MIDSMTSPCTKCTELYSTKQGPGGASVELSQFYEATQHTTQSHLSQAASQDVSRAK